MSRLLLSSISSMLLVWLKYNIISVITRLVIIDFFFKFCISKEDEVKERGRNSVTWLRIPDDPDSIVVNSKVTKNFSSATWKTLMILIIAISSTFQQN